MEVVKNKKGEGRIFYLDFMRGLAIVFMIMQHTMLVHEFTGGEGESILAGIFVILGTAPAAPIFMLIMGAFLMKSKKSAKDIFIRGVKLLLLGYGLNLVRFTIPFLIAGENSEALKMFFGVDILQLSGLTFMVAAGIRKFAKSKWIYPIGMLGIVLVSPYLWGKYDGNIICDLLWGTNSEVAFPLFPSIIYPMLGMYLNPYILKPQIDGKVKKLMLVIGGVLGILGFLTLEMFPYNDYSRYGLGATMLIISFVLIWTVLCEFLVNKFRAVRENKFSELLYYWSKNVTDIYIIQWVIYGWSALLLGTNEQRPIVAAVISFVVLIVTHLLVKSGKVTKLIPKV